MIDDFSVLDALIAADRSFAVYRRPGHAPELILQNEGLPETFDTLADLNGRSGFVMAPFQCNKCHPVVLIRTDLTIHGKSLILKFLKSLPKSAPLTEKEDDSYESKPCKVSEPIDEGYTNYESYTIYKGAFELFQKALHAGSCEKIVLSRTQRLNLPVGFSAGRLFGSACEAYPDAFVYLCHTPITGTWFGSTPELLLSGEKGNWQTVALAGTRRIKDMESNADWDPKNIREQKVVTAYLEKQLRIKNLIGSISEPYTVRAGQLMHIKTDFRFHMPEQGSVGDLLDFLHPTPAVCGYPKTEACRLILAHEGYDRAYYSGFTGLLNKEGITDLYVNLRCASLSNKNLILYAGGGLMPDSELKSEWEETEVKLQTLSSLINE
ncbi:MAG TPA: isochorismate synthase [Bacteroidales bacterium]|nr:isochorismate synthase [Bacteroidales bacterium]